MRGIAEATHFIVIVSESSLASQHVLNEIDNAHMRLPALKFKPLRLEDIALSVRIVADKYFKNSSVFIRGGREELSDAVCKVYGMMKK